jgi:hypothetical protein
MDQLDSNHALLDTPLPNNVWRVVRGFLYIAALFLIAVLICYLMAHHTSTTSGGSGWLLAALICLPFAIAMLMSAAITSFSAWRAGQALADLSKGNYLVSWTYSPEDWAAHCDEKAKGLRAIGWAFVILLTVFTIMFGIITIALPSGKRLVPGCIAAGSAILGLLIIWICRLLGQAKRARVATFPCAVIGRDALYCGGDALLWRAAGNGLLGARGIPPATPHGLCRLELIIGLAPTARKVTRATDIILFFVGQPAFVSGYRVIKHVPIPRGQEETAEHLCQIMLAGPPSPASTPPPHPDSITAPHTLACESHLAAQHHANSTPPHAEPKHRLWKITAWLLGSGAVLFSITIADSLRTGGKPSRIGSFFGVVGVILAVLSLFPLLLAIAATIRRTMR